MIDTYGAAPTFEELMKRTPAGRAILAKLAGADPEFMGKGFWKKAGAGLKKVGKFTARATGSIAKVAAGAFGIPPSAIDALARLDPTAKKALDKRLMQTPAGQAAAEALTQPPAEEKKNIFGNIKPAYIIGGAAGLGAILLLTMKKRG